MNVAYTFLLSLSVIAIGYTAKRIGVAREGDAAPLTRVILNVTLPALILRTVSVIELDFSYLFLPLFCLGYSAIVVVITWRLFRNKADDVRGLLVISSVGYNIGLFAYPLVESLWGEAGLFYLATFDIGSALTNFGLSFIVAAVLSPIFRKDATKRLRPRDLLVLPAKSVPLMSYLVALVLNLSGSAIPGFADEVLAILASGNSVLVFLVLGLLLRFKVEERMWAHIGQVLLVRYILGIATGLAMFFTLPFDILYRSVLVVALILPVSMIVVPYAVRFGYREALAGTLVNVTIVISYFVMWMIVWVLQVVV